MTRRSPLNKRYQNEQRNHESSGSTRKSAASAKIERPKFSSSKSAKSKPKTRREKFMAQARANQSKTSAKSNPKKGAPVMPDTPEYKRWRKIWWILILGALVTLIPALILNMMKLSQTKPWSYVSAVLTLLAVILVVATWILDFKKIRPLTRQAQLEAKSGKKD